MKNAKNIKYMTIVMGGIAIISLCYTNCSQMSAISTGSSSSSSLGTPLAITGGEAYVVPISFSNQNINIPTITITLCTPGTNNCQVIDNILIDTGSTGFRIFSSVINVAVNQLYQSTNVPYAECYSFASSFGLWGPVARADVILGQRKISNLIFQVANSSYASVPSDCSSFDGQTNTIATGPSFLGYNGILGIMPFSLDCGDNCTPDSSASIYYTCPNGSCSDVTMPTNVQVPNPVAALPVDNNGFAIQIPNIPSSGATTLNGAYLVLGIGTESDNKPPEGVTVIPVDSNNLFTTRFYGQNLSESFIDSGSNDFSFGPPSNTVSLATCSVGGYEFYCPNNLQELNATLIGTSGGNPINVAFNIMNANTANNSANYLFNDIGDPLQGLTDFSGLNLVFDWGCTFFFGKTIYFGMDTANVPGLGQGPFDAM